MSKKLIIASTLAIVAVASLAICLRQLNRPLTIVPKSAASDCNCVKDGRYDQLVERLGVKTIQRLNGKKAPPKVTECRNSKGDIQIKIEGEDGFASLLISSKGTEVMIGEDGVIRTLVVSPNGEGEETYRNYDNVIGLTGEPSRPLRSLLPHHSASVCAEVAALRQIARYP